MPFDVLPSHHIQFPQVQYYHPSPALAEIALEGARARYAMMLKGLDSVLNAADPLNRAQRQMAMLNLRYESKLLPMQLQYMEQYGMPMPKTPGEAMQFQNYMNQRNNAGFFNGFKGGGGSGNPYTNGAGVWNPQTGTETVTSPQGQVTVGPLEQPQSSNETLPEPQTITGGNLYDDNGNLLPPEQQGVPPNEA